MKIRIKKSDAAMVLGALVVLIPAGVVGWYLGGPVSVVGLLIISVALILFVLLEVYRRLREDLIDHMRAFESRQSVLRNQDYRQVESMLCLFFALKPALPFPAMREWVASPDLLREIAEVVLREKPGLVVEASSGVSTLVIAYCLRQLGRGKVVSLEHDAKFARDSQSLIAFHGLESVATVIHAPLKEYDINGKKWLWYDKDQAAIDLPIDLLIVDGPPGNVQNLARYPALPLLFDRLSPAAIVIADDSHRPDEKEMVARWEREFPQFRAELIGTEKGTSILRPAGRGAKA